MLAKSPIDLNKNLAKISLVLLVLVMLISAVESMPLAQAQGYPHVPTFAPSTPTPTPTTPPTATPKPSPASSPSPTEFPWNFPSISPTTNPTVQSGGFWSPLTIGLVALALVAFTVPLAFFYLRRGKQKMLREEELSFKAQELPGSNRPVVSSRYQSSYQSQQSTKPTVTMRYGQPSAYSTRQQPSSSSLTTRSTLSSNTSRLPPYTKTCPHCKRAVRNDQNVCPFCDKRIK